MPEPQIVETGDIGFALYDPSLIPHGVVALMDRFGVAITDAQGNVVRPGTSPLSLTEDEVRGWIEMTREDVEAGLGGSEPPVSVADLYNTLAPSLPAGYSVEEFAAAYDTAYAADPESVGAAVMLGMPITPEARLLRIQMWVLLMDGVVGVGTSASNGTLVAHGARSSAFLAVAQPPVTSPIPGLTDQGWATLLARLPTLAYFVPFEVEGFATVHEGHRRAGPRLDLKARYDMPIDISIDHYSLRGSLPGFSIGMTWDSDDEGFLREHGRVDGTLRRPVSSDSSGAARIAYQVKQERQNRQLFQNSESASLYARVNQLDLVNAAYELPQAIIDVLSSNALITGTRRTSNGSFPVEWHTDDVLDVFIQNDYRFTLKFTDIAELHRAGKDKVQGRLFKNEADQTYRGRLDAIASGQAQGQAILTLAGLAKCENDSLLGAQTLYVVGEQIGGGELLLRFYPETPPDDSTKCQAKIPFAGGGKYRRPAGNYLALNDKRWSTPDTGYRIEIPDDGVFTTIHYQDQTANVPELNVCSIFFVQVTRPDPNAAPTMTPFPNPGAPCAGGAAPP